METITRNQTVKVRDAKLYGRDYLVAPLTLIVPGVLNGSQGPLFYPHDEISRNPDAWNGVPIVVRHPQDSGGRHRSGRDPDVLENQGIGFVFKATANGKLKAEGWFDVERTEKVDARILQNLRAGKPIELSTGLFTDNEPAENGSSYKGKSYAYVARNYRPDHLAILPDQEGACSIRDGCGVNVNARRSDNPDGGKYAKNSNSRRSDMAKTRRLKPEVKRSIINDLINNCGDCGWTEEDREVLNKLPDEKLMTMDECRKMNMAKNEEAQKKIKELEAVVANAKKAITPDEKEKKVVTTNEKAPLTSDEIMAALTPEMKEDLAFARAEKARQKNALIDRLTANIKDDDQKASLTKWLQGKPIDELQDLLILAPAKEETRVDSVTANYAGQVAGGQVVNKAKLTYVGMPSEMDAIAKASK